MTAGRELSELLGFEWLTPQERRLRRTTVIDRRYNGLFSNLRLISSGIFQRINF